jgi:hypothetical protein
MGFDRFGGDGDVRAVARSLNSDSKPDAPRSAGDEQRLARKSPRHGRSPDDVLKGD